MFKCSSFLESSLSEQQAAVQEYLQSLNETEYSYVMNKFNVSGFEIFKRPLHCFTLLFLEFIVWYISVF